MNFFTIASWDLLTGLMVGFTFGLGGATWLLYRWVYDKGIERGREEITQTVDLGYRPYDK